MVVLMMIAACYGVLQLALLSSWTRTIRVGALLLAVAVGLYGAGVLSVLLQILYTRSMAAITDTPLSEVVATASFTVDPFIEEIIKVAPLLLLVLLHKRIRTQWGLTDYMLVGAATGSGFALTEAVLRNANAAVGLDDPAGGPFAGWHAMHGFGLTFYPGLSDVLTSWLPEMVAGGDLFGGIDGLGTNLHLVWSALAGLGVGLLFRAGWKLRLAGVGLILFAWLDHASYNQRVVRPDDDGIISALSGVMEFLNGGAWLYPLLALAAVSYLDHRAKQTDVAFPDLGGFLLKGLPWTPLIAWRFVQTRRSLGYAQAAGADTTALAELVRNTRDQMEAANSTAAWRGVGLRFKRGVRSAAQPSPAAAERMTQLPRGIRAYWQLIVWLILLLPAFLYFVVGTFPSTSGIQKLMTSGIVLPFIAVGLLWTIWNIVQTLRAPRDAVLAEPIARIDLRLLCGIGSVVIGALTLYAWLGSTGFDQPILPEAHILNALGKALIITGLLAALLGMIFFPPLGLAVLTTGEMVLILTPTAALGSTLVGAGALSGLGVLLSQAANNGGGGRGGRGSDGTPRNNQAQNKQFNDAIKQGEKDLGRKLNKGEIRRVHDEITGQNMGYHDIVEAILGLFGQ